MFQPKAKSSNPALSGLKSAAPMASTSSPDIGGQGGGASFYAGPSSPSPVGPPTVTAKPQAHTPPPSKSAPPPARRHDHPKTKAGPELKGKEVARKPSFGGKQAPPFKKQ